MINISNTYLNSLPPLGHLQATTFIASHNYIRNIWIDDLPIGITELDLEDNSLRSDGLLEEWPNSILKLNLSHNRIYSLEQTDRWPSRLVSLNLSNTNLSGVFQAGYLPDTLEFLNISNTRVSRIHKFPKALKEFIASKTQLKILPEVCNHLIEKIVVSNSGMTNWGLPYYWGKSLKFLDLNSNGINKFPENLPEGLEFINLSSNSIQEIGGLPKSVKIIHLNYNRILKIPEWFDAPFTIQNNCLLEMPTIGNCLTASYQWIGTEYTSAASLIQRAWYKRRLIRIIRTLYRNARVKSELLAQAMHPDRALVFEGYSKEWLSSVP
jgi:hypothetical protein